MKSAQQIGTIVLLTNFFGVFEDFGTFSASMVLKQLLLLCVELASAHCSTCEYPTSELDNTETMKPIILSEKPVRLRNRLGLDVPYC
jgi:hypothetical protein